MPYISTTIDTEVYIDMSDIDSDDMIDALETRGYDVYDKDAIAHHKNKIYNLYRDYIDGNNFEDKLKKFFETELGTLVA